MKRLTVLVVLTSLVYIMMAQQKINMSVNGTNFSVTLVSNQATEELLRHLQQGEIRLSTSRYGGFEQVGALPWTLPTSNSQTATSPGDVMLYNSNQLVVFFGSNSWSYTRLGRIENADQSQLESALDTPSCNIILSLPQTTGIRNISENTTPADDNRTYDLQGRSVSQPQKGIYIRNGKKVTIR